MNTMSSTLHGHYDSPREPAWVRRAAITAEPKLKRVHDVAAAPLIIGDRGCDEEQMLASTGRMVNGIVHDIRHHLSSIYAVSELMSHSSVSRAMQTEMSQEIRDSIMEMCDMLDLVLLQARHGNHFPTSIEKVDEIVNRAIRMAQCHPDGRHVEISIERRGCYRHRVNRTMLLSAIFNLVLNACQATAKSDEPGKVNVTVARIDNDTIFRVSNNGPGIPDTIRTILMGTLNASNRPVGSFGLGLTIAERAAQAHGGRLCLEESQQGKTVFTLEIPCT